MKYTKKPLSPVTSSTTSKEPSTKPSVSEPTIPSQRLTKVKLPSIDLLLRTRVRRENVDGVLSALRSERGLRELTSAESGRSVHEVSSGTYFYLLGTWLHGSSVVRDGSVVMDFTEGFNSLSVSRYRSSSNYVEVHDPRGEEPHLVLFLDEVSASTVAKLPGDQPREVTAAITPWDSATTLVSVPVSRIERSRTREVEVSQEDSLLVLDMLLR